MHHRGRSDREHLHQLSDASTPGRPAVSRRGASELEPLRATRDRTARDRRAQPTQPARVPGCRVLGPRRGFVRSRSDPRAAHCRSLDLFTRGPRRERARNVRRSPMKLAGEYTFEAGVQEVWDALFDPAVLAAVMPGCEKVDLVDRVEPTSYKMIVDGRGAQGFVKATATIELAAEGTGTKIRYDSDAQVGGKIATVGQRLVETSARAIVKQSLEGLAENIKIRSAAYRTAAPVAAPEAKVVEPSVEAPK